MMTAITVAVAAMLADDKIVVDNAGVAAFADNDAVADDEIAAGNVLLMIAMLLLVPLLQPAQLCCCCHCCCVAAFVDASTDVPAMSADAEA